MSKLLSLDLVLLEEKLRSEVEEKFGERTWDKVECDNVYDEIVKNGKTWIPKKANEPLRKFENFLNEITITGNGILLKLDRIILPESLQDTVIQLAHRGSHVGQSGLERRLRYHFFSTICKATSRNL